MTQSYSASNARNTKPDTPSRKLTDLGNAERLADRQTGKLVYVKGIGWMTWDGRRWAEAQMGEEIRASKEMVRSIYGEAARCLREASRAKGEAERKRLSGIADAINGWARKSEAGSKIREAVNLARSDERLACAVDSLDADPGVLNVRNGILDLDTLELRPHDPSAMHTRIALAAYEPGARSPRFEEFIERIQPATETRLADAA